LLNGGRTVSNLLRLLVTALVEESRNLFAHQISLRRFNQRLSGVISANHWGSNISYSTTSLSPCYCDV